MKKLDNNGNATDAGNNQSIFVLTTLEKIKETRSQYSQGSVTVLQNMESYEEARVKLTNTQLNKSKSAAKNKTGTTLITKKNFQDEEVVGWFIYRDSALYIDSILYRGIYIQRLFIYRSYLYGEAIYMLK